MQCTVDLAVAHLLRGEENSVEVLAWNRDERVSSRGATRHNPPAGGSKHAPEHYAIVVGISEYASPSLRLRYAAKDANDMARAIDLAVRGLFGAERVHITRLVTGDPLVNAPSKRNLEAAFTSIRSARPEDVLVVYLAGHGSASGNDYVFPHATRQRHRQ